MPPAIIAGGIAALGTVGGALIASGASNSAANQAANTEQASTQAQLQLGQQALGLNQDIYNSNYNLLSPFVGRGNEAGQSINALLGVPNAPAQASPLQQPVQPTPTQQAPTGPNMQQIMAMQHDGIPGNFQAALNGLATQQPQSVQHLPTPIGTPTPVASAPVPQTPSATQPNALSPQGAFNNFANSAGMQFQLQQGANALNNLYAAHGDVQSGAAAKALQNYGQQTALNNYFLPYIGLLGNQQSIGAQAGSAVAGVGSSFGNTAAGIASGQSGALQNGADAAANASLVRGANNANLFNGLGTALGNIGSSFMSQPSNMNALNNFVGPLNF